MATPRRGRRRRHLGSKDGGGAASVTCAVLDSSGGQDGGGTSAIPSGVALEGTSTVAVSPRRWRRLRCLFGRNRGGIP